eukprot:5486143-Amphidinium_carterae.1
MWYKLKAQLTEPDLQHDAYARWCRAGNKHVNRWEKAGATWHLEGSEHLWRRTQLVQDSVRELASWVGVQVAHEEVLHCRAECRTMQMLVTTFLAEQAPEVSPRRRLNAFRAEKRRIAHSRYQHDLRE